MQANRMHQPGRGFRRIVLPAGVALTLLLAGCSSKSTPVASASSSPSSSASSAAVASAPASAPASSAPASSAPVSSAPASSTPVSSGPASSAPAASAPVSSGPASSAPAASAPASSGVAGSELPKATVNTTDANALKALSAMRAALLTPAEVGTGFAKNASAAEDPSQKLPCGGYSAAALYPNALRTELIADKGSNVQFQESLNLYLDVATSSKAFDTSVAGLNCAQGSISGTSVTIGKPMDVTAEVGGTKAVAWELTIDGATGVLIAVNAGSSFIGFTFLAATGADTTTLPNPLTLAKKGTAKIVAGGLG